MYPLGLADEALVQLPLASVTGNGGLIGFHVTTDQVWALGVAGADTINGAAVGVLTGEGALCVIISDGVSAWLTVSEQGMT